MQKKGVKYVSYFVIFVLILVFFNMIIVKGNENSVTDEKVYRALENNESVRVLIDLKEEKGIFGLFNNEEANVKEISEQIGNESLRNTFDNAVSADLNETELIALEKNSEIERISLVPVRKLFLQDSVPLINGTQAYPLQINNTNLTGTGVSVCIIDSGVNYSHPDLGGCYGNNTASSGCKVIGGYDFVNGDSDPMDDHGHGTHVAGIVGANGTIRGIAPGVKIIAMKACNSGGSCSDDNIKSAINWCVGNSSTYNITVISMSLGAGSYSSYCDNVDDPVGITGAINSAALKNISVVVASGNDGSSSTISSPACIRNATAISSTDKSDGISSFSNRNSLVQLMAPGTSINSTGGPSASGCTTIGRYMTCSGTSMATPHAAGAIAILSQFLFLTNQTRTIDQIKTVLNSSGKQIYDSSSNLNYSRISVYSALGTLSFTYHNLVTPSDNLIVSRNLTFTCNDSSGVALRNITFSISNSSGLVYNLTQNVSGFLNSSNFSYNFTSEGSYSWNCLSANNLSFYIQGNKTITYDITKPNISIISPLNNSYQNAGRFNVTINENGSCIFSMNSGVNNITMNTSNNLSFGYVNSTLTQNGNYNVTYYCNDTAGNLNSSLIRFFTVDLTAPNVSSISPDDSFSATGTTNVLFQYNVTDNLNISSCGLVLNGATVASNESTINNQTNNITYSVSSGSYTWSVNCTDIAGNIGNSSSRSMTINSASVSSSGNSGGGGGGGGGGGSIITGSVTSGSISNYNANEVELSIGYQQTMKEGESISFKIENESHNVTIDKIENNSATIIVRSSPQTVKLNVGEEKKLSLTSYLYYDLYLKLNSITNNKTDLTIRKIHENISTVNNEQVNNSTQEVIKENKTSFKSTIITISVIIAILIIIGAGYWVYKHHVSIVVKYNKVKYSKFKVKGVDSGRLSR